MTSLVGSQWDWDHLAQLPIRTAPQHCAHCSIYHIYTYLFMPAQKEKYTFSFLYQGSGPIPSHPQVLPLSQPHPSVHSILHLSAGSIARSLFLKTLIQSSPFNHHTGFLLPFTAQTPSVSTLYPLPLSPSSATYKLSSFNSLKILKGLRLRPMILTVSPTRIS